MHLNDDEKSILQGEKGEIHREALDYIVQLGDAFQAEKLVDISYCHYPAEMAIYKGSVEDLIEYSIRGARVCVPTTTSTLCCDLERPENTKIPQELFTLQAKVEKAHRDMGILETYTCTPQKIGFVPPFRANIATVESSAIIYYNSALGCRTNRGGLFTRYSAVTGKYPLMGYLLDENRKGTHLFTIEIPCEKLNSYDKWCALGFHIGSIVGSEVPVIDNIKSIGMNDFIGLGSALATSGSVTLFHITGITPEARNLNEAFQGSKPKHEFVVTENDLDAVYEKMNTLMNPEIDFVTLGCPHYNLEQIRYVAEKLEGKRVAKNVRFWICTNRMTRMQAEYSGYVRSIEESGAIVVADTCPVESHMRKSTCREYSLRVPNVDSMVTDSVKMARYVGDLIGCKTALTDTDSCIEAAVKGRIS